MFTYVLVHTERNWILVKTGVRKFNETPDFKRIARKYFPSQSTNQSREIIWLYLEIAETVKMNTPVENPIIQIPVFIALFILEGPPSNYISTCVTTINTVCRQEGWRRLIDQWSYRLHHVHIEQCCFFDDSEPFSQLFHRICLKFL